MSVVWQLAVQIKDLTLNIQRAILHLDGAAAKPIRLLLYDGAHCSSQSYARNPVATQTTIIAEARSRKARLCCRVPRDICHG